MSNQNKKKRTSLQLNDTLSLGQNKSNKSNQANAGESICRIGVSEKSIHRKGGLKPQGQRLYSENRIESRSKIRSTRSIKSGKSIKFKNSNEFEKFTYIKEQNQNKNVKYDYNQGNKQKSYCSIV